MERWDGWLRLAHNQGRSLTECLEKNTYQQYLLWMEWYRQEFSTPNRTDYYIMQVAREVAQVLGKSVDMDKFKLKFKFTEMVHKTLEEIEAEKKAKKKAITEASKAKWLSAVGISQQTGPVQIPRQPQQLKRRSVN